MIFRGICLLTGAIFSATSFASMDIGSFATPHVEGEMIVSFDSNVSKVEVDRLVQECGGKVLKAFRSSNSVLIATGISQNEMINSAALLSDVGEVSYVGLNRKIKHHATTPNDPMFSRAYEHTLIGTQQGAWDITTGSRNITAAVIDTGVWYEHPDLAGNIWSNPGETGLDENGVDRSTNGIDDDGNGYIDDFRGWDFVNNDNDPKPELHHGTHVAGILGAVGNNAEGVTGVAWQVSLVPLKIISRSEGSEAAAAEAIEYATMMGFDVANNSWGYSTSEPNSGIIYDALVAAEQKDILMVFSAGNEGKDIDDGTIAPASFDLDNIISVANSNRVDNLFPRSNVGVESVDIAAPGTRINSTLKLTLGGGRYEAMTGTSMSAPMVSGAIVLLKTVYPNESGAEIKARILDGADPIEAGKDTLKTGGRLNILNSLNL